MLGLVKKRGTNMPKTQQPITSFSLFKAGMSLFILSLARTANAQGLNGLYSNSTQTVCYSLFYPQAALSCLPASQVDVSHFPQNNTWIALGG